jgi:hypothetical protein
VDAWSGTGVYVISANEMFTSPGVSEVVISKVHWMGPAAIDESVKVIGLSHRFLSHR